MSDPATNGILGYLDQFFGNLAFTALKLSFKRVLENDMQKRVSAEASHLPHGDEEGSSLNDLGKIPVCNPKVLTMFKAHLQHCWPTMQQLASVPVTALVPHFFPNHIERDQDKRWTTFYALNEAIEKHRQECQRAGSEGDEVLQQRNLRTELELLLRRAVVSLQCELALHAYSDVLIVGNAIHHHESKKGQASLDLSLSNASIVLIQIFASMMMNQYYNYEDGRSDDPALSALMQRLKDVLFHQMKQSAAGAGASSGGAFGPLSVITTSAATATGSTTELLCEGDLMLPLLQGAVLGGDTSMIKQSLQSYLNNAAQGFLSSSYRDNMKPDSKQDKYLIAALVIVEVAMHYNSPTPSNTASTTTIEDTNASTTAVGIEGSIIEDVATLSHEKLDPTDQDPTESQREVLVAWNPFIVLLVKCLAEYHFDLQERDRIKKETLHKIAISKNVAERSQLEAFMRSGDLCIGSSKLPMEYRLGEGGERDPNNVLRTLFTLRRDVMEHVRVAVDTDKGGFKLVAKKDIEKDEVFLIERPFALFDGYTTHTNPYSCAHCYCDLDTTTARTSSGRGMISCKGCGDRYCSEQCRQEAWDHGHKKLCFGTSTGKEWNTFVRSLGLETAITGFSFNLCIALKLMVKADCLGLSSAFELPEVKILRRATDTNEPFDRTAPSGPPLLRWDRSLKLLNTFETFLFRCPSVLSSTKVSVVDFVLLHSMVAVNASGGKKPHFSPPPVTAANKGHEVNYRSELCIGFSYCNHDCDPNACFANSTRVVSAVAPKKSAFMVGQIIDKEEVIMRALRPIASGEEITISYVTLTSDYKSRQYQLAATYGIEKCTCRRCIEEEHALPLKASTSSSNKKKGDRKGKK